MAKPAEPILARRLLLRCVTATWRVQRWVVFVIAALLLLATSPPAAAQSRVPDGSAPPPGTPPIEVRGFVRVIDGDSMEVRLDGKQVGIGIVGVNVPMGNTPCGREATERLRRLVMGGMRLEDVSGEVADERGRRMFRVLTLDGRDVATELTRAGLARASGRGPHASALQALEEQARVGNTGCASRAASINDGGLDQVGTGADDQLADETSTEPDSLQMLRTGIAFAGADASQAAPSITTPSFPTRAATLPASFVEEGVAAGLSNPKNFLFTPDGRIFVALKGGIIRVVKNGALLPAPLIDLRDRVNDYWDRGLLSIALGQNFATDGTLYIY